MEYGGSYPVSNLDSNWTSAWREWQYQRYQKHLSKEDEDEVEYAMGDLNERILREGG